MRTVKVHSDKSIRFTQNAASWCQMLNAYKKHYPNSTFKDMAKLFNLSETNARRYYYGVHHVNGEAIRWAKGYTQMRQGAAVHIVVPTVTA